MTPHAIEHMGEGGGGTPHPLVLYPTPPGIYMRGGGGCSRGGGGQIEAATRQALLFQSSQT